MYRVHAPASNGSGEGGGVDNVDLDLIREEVRRVFTLGEAENAQPPSAGCRVAICALTPRPKASQNEARRSEDRLARMSQPPSGPPETGSRRALSSA
jgi:hypothetical protein